MTTKIKITILILYAVVSCFGQTCVTQSRNPWEWPGHSNWFIGEFPSSWQEAGIIIDFKGGFSKSTLGGGSIAAAMPVYEGVTSASNDQGQLVVFSNGRIAWDAAGNRVSTDVKEGNEGGNNIVGSAAQGIMTVRHPLNPYEYYVITVGDVIGGANPPLSYNIFDDSGTEIQGNTSLGVQATEGITATLHANGVDIWVSTLEYGSNTLHSFLLTCQGFVTPSVKTNLGYPQSGDAGRGGVAFSHDGSMFAACFPNAWPNADRQVVLYDFDNSTGKFSNRRSIGPTGAVIGPYDVVFSKDNSKVMVTGGNAGGLHSVDVVTGAHTAETSPGQLSMHHAIEIGPDGNYYLNGKDGLWRYSGSGNFTKVDNSTGQGLPTIYIPPAEEPDIVEVGPLCDTSGTVNLETYWLCSGVNAEDTITGPSSVHSKYSGPGIIYDGQGIFDPKVAGVGIHEIIFTKCAVDDTIWIEVKQCVTCIDTLQNISPVICAGETVNLTAAIDTSNGPGIWTIDSFPSSNFVNATIDESGADTLFDATDLNTKPGQYKVMFTVTKDGQTCKDSLYVTVNSNPVINVNDSTICAGDGAALFSATSDSVAVSYQWGDNGSGTDPTTTGSTPGIYTVLVTDQNGCVGRDTGELFVNALPVVSVNNDTICAGVGTGNFIATSDSAVASYTWSDNGSGNDPTTTGTTAGNYTVTIVDENGCEGSASGTLIVNQSPVVTVNDSVICDGDAPATFIATSDSAAASYMWSDNGTGTDPTTSGTVAGDYTVTIVDENGCEGSATGVLTVNALPLVNVNNNEICVGDPAVVFTATSDSTPVSYLWSDNGLGTEDTTSGNIPGDYTVTVTDVNGCVGTGTGVLTINQLPVVTVSDTEICDGDAPATFTAVVDSAVSAYSWAGNGTGNGVTTTGSTAGEYIVSIVDENGCTDADTGVLIVHDLPIVVLDGGNVCPNTPFTLSPNVTTQNSPSSFSWNSGEITQNIQKGPGTYTVTVTDAKGCVETASATVVEDPNLTVVIPGPIDICLGEDTLVTSNFSAADGYSFDWTQGGTSIGTDESLLVNTSGTYDLLVNKGNCMGNTSVDVTVHDLPVVTVNNAEICDGDDPAIFTATAPTATNYLWQQNGSGTQNTTQGVNQGAYEVVVTDANGCENTASGTLTVHSLPTVTVNDATICEGDPAAVFTANSTSATTYNWSGNGSGSQNSTQGTSPGQYIVEVADANGCKATGFGTLTVNAIPVVSVNSTTICEGDNPAIFTATADSQVVTYAWSDNGTGTQNTTQGAIPGDYTVTIEDIHGCIGTGKGVLIVEPLPVVSDQTASICEGEAAIIGEVVSNGNYTYTWQNKQETSAQISVNQGGIYTRTVTSNAGCSNTSSYTVTEHLNPIVDIESKTQCAQTVMTLEDNEDQNGYSYDWQPGNLTGGAINPTANENYTITKTDNATGCFISTQASATFIPIPNINIDPDTVDICEGDEANLMAVHDGDEIYWNDNSATNSITTTTQGLYIATSANNQCSASDSVFVRVTQYPVSELDKTLAQNPICFEELEQPITLVASTNRDYEYLWSTDERTNSITINGEGIYSVIISNGNCSVTDNISFKDYCPWTLFVPNAITPNDDGKNDYFFAKGNNIIDFEMYIFNRWGEKIFETNNIHDGWDGTYFGNPVQIDVYVYKIVFTTENIKGLIDNHTRVGKVTVVR